MPSIAGLPEVDIIQLLPRHSGFPRRIHHWLSALRATIGLGYPYFKVAGH
jgi:hypothetical protein